MRLMQCFVPSVEVGNPYFPISQPLPVVAAKCGMKAICPTNESGGIYYVFSLFHFRLVRGCSMLAVVSSDMST